MAHKAIKYESLDHELRSRGYLSLNKALKYWAVNYPSCKVSYPTALKLVESGKINTIRVGGMHRVYEVEIHRFGVHGNATPEDEGSEDV